MNRVFVHLQPEFSLFSTEQKLPTLPSCIVEPVECDCMIIACRGFGWSELKINFNIWRYLLRLASPPKLLILICPYGAQKMVDRINAEFEVEIAFAIAQCYNETLLRHCLGVVETSTTIHDFKMNFVPIPSISMVAEPSEPFYDSDVNVVRQIVAGVHRGGREGSTFVNGAPHRSRAIALQVCKILRRSDFTIFHTQHFEPPAIVPHRCFVWLEFSEAPPDKPVYNLLRKWPAEVRFILTSAFDESDPKGHDILRFSICADFNLENLEVSSEQVIPVLKEIRILAIDMAGRPREVCDIFGHEEVARAINESLPPYCYLAAIFDGDDEYCIARIDVCGNVQEVDSAVQDGSFNAKMVRALYAECLELKIESALVE